MREAVSASRTSPQAWADPHFGKTLRVWCERMREGILAEWQPQSPSTDSYETGRKKPICSWIRNTVNHTRLVLKLRRFLFDSQLCVYSSCMYRIGKMVWAASARRLLFRLALFVCISGRFLVPGENLLGRSFFCNDQIWCMLGGSPTIVLFFSLYTTEYIFPRSFPSVGSIFKKIHL